MDILYKPYLKEFKTPIGALNIFEEVKLNIYIKENYQISNLKIFVYDDDKSIFEKDLIFSFTKNQYNCYTVSFSLDTPYLYWYYFSFNDCYGKHYIGRDDSLNAKLFDDEVQSFQLNVTYPTENDLKWYQGMIMYQILVDRFFKGGNNSKKEKGYFHSNWDDKVCYLPIDGQYNIDFFGGDLEGIIKKLPYLQNLNVGVIYLNPIFLSPTSHKYNISDYLMIDPMYGTIDDFTRLCKEAQKYGIYIILDGVYNHTGDDSIYFNKYGNFPNLGAYQSKDSIYHDWYKFIKYPNEYVSWWGIKSLPSVNQNSGFVNFICNEVIPKWIKCGAKGYRLDVVDELNDNFVQKINSSIKHCDKDAIVIGEVWEDATNKISYSRRRTYFNGCELDSVMNYVIKDAIIDYLKNNKIEHLVYKLREMVNNYPKKVLDSLMNILSTHDTSRVLTSFSHIDEFSLSDKEKVTFLMSKEDYLQARSKLKMAFTILYTIPGVPCIYYGDEVGMEGYRDPFCRKSMSWDKFDEDILNHLILLGQIRNNEVYKNGIYQEISFENNVLIFKRYNDKKSIITIINNSEYEYKYYLNKGFDLFDDLEINNIVLVYPKTSKIIDIIF